MGSSVQPSQYRRIFQFHGQGKEATAVAGGRGRGGECDKAGADRPRLYAAGFPSHTPAHRNEQTRPVDPQIFKRKGGTAGPAATGFKPVRRATDCAPERAAQPRMPIECY